MLTLQVLQSRNQNGGTNNVLVSQIGYEVFVSALISLEGDQGEICIYHLKEDFWSNDSFITAMLLTESNNNRTSNGLKC